MKNQAIGILETQGLTAILQATDSMLKAADVELVGKEKIGAAYVTIIIRGDVAAVQSAVDAGANAVGGLGKVIAAHVFARPHESLLRLLPGQPASGAFLRIWQRRQRGVSLRAMAVPARSESTQDALFASCSDEDEALQLLARED